jgi:tellurite resistance-related uncharacterized protein
VVQSERKFLELPAGLTPYKRTAEWTEHTVPKALLREHTTKPDVWASIVVLEGELRYVVLAHGVELVLSAGRSGVVLPGVAHHIEPLGAVRFYVEFLRESLEGDAPNR